jgi:LmbE family N-acetylglucosaminyl deacetylase
MEDWYLPYSPSSLPVAQNVLVLAPHPDDEIFGCGGCLALYRRAGVNIHVYVLSDGAGYAEAEDRAEIYLTRQAETNAALASLGIGPAVFEGLADRSLAAQAELSSLIAEKVRQHQVDVILAPSMWEIHPDHLATFRAAWSAATELLRAGEPVPTLLLYEVGAPQCANLLVDITQVWSEKQSAMLLFPSQLAHQDYTRHIQALNTYRTYTLPASVRFAEALSLVTPDQIASADEPGFDPIRHMMKVRMDSAMIAAEEDNSVLQSALGKRTEELQRRTAEAQRAETAFDLATSRAEAIRRQLDEAGLYQQRLCSQLAEAQRDRDEARQRLEMTLNSRAWRITAPLRWLSRLLRSFR